MAKNAAVAQSESCAIDSNSFWLFPCFNTKCMAAENVAAFGYETAADAVAVLRYLICHGIATGTVSFILVHKEMTIAPVAYLFECGEIQRVASGGNCASFVLLTGCTVFAGPNEPTLLVAGPFGRCLFRTLQNEALFGGMGAIAGALYSLGMTRDVARRHEAAAREGGTLIVIQGRAREVARARELLARWQQSFEDTRRGT